MCLLLPRYELNRLKILSAPMAAVGTTSMLFVVCSLAGYAGVVGCSVSSARCCL